MTKIIGLAMLSLTIGLTAAASAKVISGHVDTGVEVHFSTSFNATRAPLFGGCQGLVVPFHGGHVYRDLRTTSVESDPVTDTDGNYVLKLVASLPNDKQCRWVKKGRELSIRITEPRYQLVHWAELKIEQAPETEQLPPVTLHCSFSKYGEMAGCDQETIRMNSQDLTINVVVVPDEH